MKILGVDASNLRSGGAVAHLLSFLENADPAGAGFHKIVVWAWPGLREKLPNRWWLAKPRVSALGHGLLMRAFWQHFRLPAEARRADIDVLFSPGGTLPWRIRVPTVVMFRNSLPFDRAEKRRYHPLSALRLRFETLRFLQTASIRRADGVIFLSTYGQELVSRWADPELSVVIPHGVNTEVFGARSRSTSGVKDSADQPIRLLHVSPVRAYKHHHAVLQSVYKLRQQGFHLVLEIAGGPEERKAVRDLQNAIRTLDPDAEFVNWLGHVDRRDLPDLYADADIFVFASTCENLPNTLLEAMAAGLPTVVANKPPMAEIIGEAGVTFELGGPRLLDKQLRSLIEDPIHRLAMSDEGRRIASGYSWTDTSQRTLEFVGEVAELVRTG